MATKITEFSTAAGENTDISGVSVAEGWAPSNVNNSIRALCAQLADAFALASPGTELTAVWSSNFIVKDADTITIGTNGQTVITHDDSANTNAGETSITTAAGGTLKIAGGKVQFDNVVEPSLDTQTGSYTWDVTSKQVLSLTASGATTLTFSNVSSLPVGTDLGLIVTDAASASLTFAGATLHAANGTAPSLNGTAGETLLVGFRVIGSGILAVVGSTTVTVVS